MIATVEAVDVPYTFDQDFTTDSTDSPDCLSILLNRSVFSYFLVFCFPLFSFSFRAVDKDDLCRVFERTLK